MWYRCDSLPGPDPGGTLAIDRKDGDLFSCSGEKRYRLSGRADHAYLSTSVCVILAKLSKFRVQAATRSDEKMPTMLERMVFFVTVGAKRPVFSEGISAR